MGPYRHDDQPLPTKEEVREWLRRRITKSPPSRWRRWLGAPTSFRYEIDEPVPWVTPFFGVHRLFTVHANEPDLLPLLRWEGRRAESWGIFAEGPGGLELLLPRDGSLSRLLRAEGRPLDDDGSGRLIELVCALELGDGSDVHTVVPQAKPLREPKSRWYEVDEEKLLSFGGHLLSPSIQPLQGGGWQLQFSTVVRRNARPVELAVELMIVSPDFAIHRHSRQVVAYSAAFVIANPARVDEPDDAE